MGALSPSILIDGRLDGRLSSQLMGALSPSATQACHWAGCSVSTQDIQAFPHGKKLMGASSDGRIDGRLMGAWIDGRKSMGADGLKEPINIDGRLMGAEPIRWAPRAYQH